MFTHKGSKNLSASLRPTPSCHIPGAKRGHIQRHARYCSGSNTGRFPENFISLRKAIADHLHYVWIDTCCINKSSSAELSESTNSMFRWYVEAKVYYAYLSDLGGLFNPRGLRQSRWFTRGWTLQELLAPRKVLFYSEDWTHLGSKSSLVTSLSEATQIDRDVLLDPGKLCKKPIACRMSWPAGRETTRIEDIAYSLLGIFNVYMALLYGEGTNAFLRLQEEIMKISTDSSLFTWNILHRQEYNEANILVRRFPYTLLSLLAKSPSQFVAADMIWHLRADVDKPGHLPTMTSKGLNIQIPLLRDTMKSST